MTTKAINVLICSVLVFGITNSAEANKPSRPAPNVAKLMYRAANPRSGFEKRLVAVRRLLALKSSVPKGMRTSALLLERQLMRSLIDKHGDSLMHGFSGGSMEAAAQAYGSGPFTKADRVHRRAAKLFNYAAGRQLGTIEAELRALKDGSAREQAARGWDPVQELKRDAATMRKVLNQPVAKAQGERWLSEAKSRLAAIEKQQQGVITGFNQGLKQEAAKKERADNLSRALGPWAVFFQ
jgi:hypothetical protein